MRLLFTLLLLGTAAVAQTPVESPSTFVSRIYAALHANTSNSSIDYPATRRKIFSAPIVKLLAADEQRTPKGEQGALDADPLCQCQDDDGLQVASLRGKLLDFRHAMVHVTLSFRESPAQRKELDLRLVSQAGAWRVEDVIPTSGPTLRQLLTNPPAIRAR